MASKLAKVEGAVVNIAERAPETSVAANLPTAFWSLPQELQEATIDGLEVPVLHAAVVQALIQDTGLEASALTLILVERFARLYIYTRVRENQGIGSGGASAVDEIADNGFKDDRAYKDVLQQLNNQAAVLQKIGYASDESAIRDNILDKVDDHIEVAISNLPTEWQSKVRSAIDMELKQADF
jgi:hypothetical protein